MTFDDEEKWLEQEKREFRNLAFWTTLAILVLLGLIVAWFS